MSRSKNGSTIVERPKRTTLQDIADVMGVKKMVVSNALNGTRSVAPATRDKVLKIARELNYIPNFAARALVTGRTNIVAILSGPINEAYYANMVHLLEKQVSSQGYHLLLLRTRNEVRELIDSSGPLAVDGVLAVDMLELVDEFRSHPSIPCVSIGTFAPSFVDNVIVDLNASVREALEIMWAYGRKRIAYLVTADFMAEKGEVRARTYLEMMEKVGQKAEIINVLTDDSDVVEERLRAYLGASGCPEGLLCQNDETAMCAYRVFKNLGYEVPTDVLLVGCDGQVHMKYFDPPLSTIVQPMEEMCVLAWEFLHRRILEPGSPHQHVTLQGKLIVRESLQPQR